MQRCGQPRDHTKASYACRVSVFQVWRDSDLVQRVPIIVTGNDFSTLFAPLVRDGRMSKFYWEPDRVDLLNICHQMYKVLHLQQCLLPRQPCVRSTCTMKFSQQPVALPCFLFKFVVEQHTQQSLQAACLQASSRSLMCRAYVIFRNGSDVLLLLSAQDDGLSMGDMELMLDSFKGQSLDFFGAMRSATYDNQIRDWIKDIVEDDISAEGANLQELSRRLINRCATVCPKRVTPAIRFSSLIPCSNLTSSNVYLDPTFLISSQAPKHKWYQKKRAHWESVHTGVPPSM